MCQFRDPKKIYLKGLYQHVKLNYLEVENGSFTQLIIETNSGMGTEGKSF